MIHGTDVSSYQPEQFPLELPDGTPVEFVMIKVTQSGAYTNPKWKAQAAWARQHGLAVGFYHFGVSGSTREQANFFNEELGALWPGETLWYDWENLAGVAPTNAEKDEFIKELKRLRPGRKVGLYCNVDYWKNRDTTSYYGDALWIASWAPGEPPIEAAWTVHQYSDGGGKADHNRAKFFSPEEMKVWGGKLEDVTVTLLREIRGLVRELRPYLGAEAGRAQDRHREIMAALDGLDDTDELTTKILNQLARRLES